MKYALIFSSLILMNCNNSQTSAKETICIKKNKNAVVKINENENTLQTRFEPPLGFVRTKIETNSFDAYLRNLPLKKMGEPVLYYNGTAKTKQNVYISVVNLPIGNKDLHQCADAVMNLYANYLFANKRYKDIQFKFLGDTQWHNFKTWAGKRKINYALFFDYMQQVFSAANTRSLYQQLHAVSSTNAAIGDVFIVTGNPYGHAIAIVDNCINIQTGKKLFMLAQSYMPAQETQILINPTSHTLSPWYDIEDNNGLVETPEWQFTTNDIRRF